MVGLIGAYRLGVGLDSDDGTPPGMKVAELTHRLGVPAPQVSVTSDNGGLSRGYPIRMTDPRRATTLPVIGIT